MDFTKINDLTLLEAVCSGDQGAFQELFRRYWEPLYLFALRRLKSESDAEDIVQEFFIRLWGRRSQLEITTTVAAYFHSSIHYEVLAKLSKNIKEKKRSAEVTQAILADFTQGVPLLELKELVAIVEAAIRELPPKMQEVYRMRQEKDMTIREIGQLLNISEHTARNQLNTAYRKLGMSLKEVLVSLIITLAFLDNF